MRKLYKKQCKAFFLFGLFYVLISASSTAQTVEQKTNRFTNAFQLYVSGSYSPGSSVPEHYIRKGYIASIGVQKPVCATGDDEFQQVFSLTAAFTYGKLDANGAQMDLLNQVDPIAFAVPNSLAPKYVNDPGKATLAEWGVGVQEDLYFGRLGMGFGVQFGYQFVSRPGFRLEDAGLRSAQTNAPLVYAQAEQVSATGFFVKPSFTLHCRLSSRVMLYTELSYSFGPRFNDNQLVWMARTSDGDPYLNVQEIQAGYLSATRIQGSVNMLRIGAGLRYALN